MIAATGVFLNSGVDIISIMLGTNETRPVNDYKANMQTIIDILKNEGFKHVILNQLIYKPGGLSQLPLIQQYNTVLVDLVAENSGFVLLGDTQAYAATEAISGVGFYDGAHPNNTGYQKIGELWADAIRSALEYQINPTHQRSGNTTYQLTTS
jgi:lysophospholipase L1-like esterase